MIGKDPRPSEDHIRRTREMHGFLLPALREVARRHGYALAVHGSLERDIDIIAVPWRDGAIEAGAFVAALYAAVEAICGYVTGPGGWTSKETFKDGPPAGSLPNPDRKPHGRLAWSFILGGGPYIDISVMPVVKPEEPKKNLARSATPPTSRKAP